MVQKKWGSSGNAATLGRILLIAVSTIVLIAVTGRILGAAEDGTQDSACALSLTTSTFGIGAVNCPMRRISVFEDNIKINEHEYRVKLPDSGDFQSSNKWSSKSTFDQDEFENAMYFLFAEELRKCWKKIGEGKKNILPRNFFSDSDQFCIHCAEITFEDLAPKEFENLRQYLNYATLNNLGSKTTYADYLIHENPKIEFLFWDFEPDEKVTLQLLDDISTSKRYYISASIINENFLETQLDDDDEQLLYLLPANMEQHCEVIIAE